MDNAAEVYSVTSQLHVNFKASFSTMGVVIRFSRNRKRFFPNLFVTSQNRALVSCTCVKTLFADGGTYKFTDGGT